MKTKKILFLIVPVLICMASLYVFSSFKTNNQSYKISCQFSPATGDFATVEMENCNNLKINSAVQAGSSWTATLLPHGCDEVFISTSLPEIHPAGTMRIYKNGVLQMAHTVTQNQPANFFDSFAASFSDQFLVTW